ncbi:MAG: diguanylate cyclase [Hoeflea sp.]|uniref:bifunctional diguanylate cyclase/phosphodiesterase n=1 Tax=Hoeflea sp. TaxID=1940281 RepID=UPI000C0E0550|nr:EAL domain-containing protein [Hoeflea sp.]PHR17792.1 MAG: diguanylate cyclase [Hoeflea sp.]
MSKFVSLFNGMTGRITLRLLVIVAVSILITASLGYFKLSQVTEVNSFIRIDRAARAATALFTEKLNSEFSAINDPDGKPMALRLKSDTVDMSLSFRDVHDTLLKEIGHINQGAANLFRLNSETRAFDRFATTFRRPDGSMPPPMSIGSGHPAYADIINNQPHLGEVPVMGRLRLAYLTPIQTESGAVAGALAVDVGWVDDLVVARNELRTQIVVAAILILILVAAFGVLSMSRELKPLRQLAKYADDLAAEAPAVAVPFKSREDEIGALAQGLERVVTLQGKLAHLAYADELTGLGNRSRYLTDLKKSLLKNLSGKHKSTLLHLDLDNFKQINDAYGQETGDALLKTVATQIVDTAGETSQIARLASDQFTILVSDKSSAVQPVELAEKLLTALRQPFQLAAGEVRLTASIGIVLLQHDAEDADEAHRNAGLAMHKAKASGGDQFMFFSSEMNDVLQDQIRMDRMLQIAIEEREIEIHFQPQIIPSTGGLAGVEALARWTHPAEGPISPGKFIPIAEASGQIVGLGTLVLDLACEQAAKWRDQEFDFKHISVNVSTIQLWQPNFIDVLKAALERHNVPGRNIYIEITESVFVDHSESRIAMVLAAIRAIGVKLSLDDFGSGYSSLGYLNRLPFDQLKVDRSFISDIDTDQRKQQVLRGVLGLGRGLGFNVVVEGAETLEEVTLVEQLGCDSVQGFYYARPAPALLIPDMVRKIAQSKTRLNVRSA